MSHIWMSHVTYESVTSNINESCHLWISHVTYKRVMSQCISVVWQPLFLGPDSGTRAVDIHRWYIHIRTHNASIYTYVCINSAALFLFSRELGHGVCVGCYRIYTQDLTAYDVDIIYHSTHSYDMCLICYSSLFAQYCYDRRRRRRRRWGGLQLKKGGQGVSCVLVGKGVGWKKDKRQAEGVGAARGGGGGSAVKGRG